MLLTSDMGSKLHIARKQRIIYANVKNFNNVINTNRQEIRKKI